VAHHAKHSAPIIAFGPTEKCDRGIKLQHYRAIESLRDYILVSQDQILVEQYTRADAQAWTFRDYQSASHTLLIPSIGVSLPLARIYERIDFAAQ
jgi:Uma2 family endonuclease